MICFSNQVNNCMRLSSIQPITANWSFDYHPVYHIDYCNDKKNLCKKSNVHQYTNISDIRLNEATYKEIAGLIDGDFLKQKVRADVLKGIQFMNFDKDIMNFEIESSEFASNGIHYLCGVQFMDWDNLMQDSDFNYIERARLLLWSGDIKLHCTCPSFLYWGYQYLLTSIDASVYPETRKPVVRNPQERGIVCKHLNRILRALPFYSGEIAKGLKDQFSPEDEEEEELSQE